MEKKTVRIGFVGVGGMGQSAHLKNYVTVPDCEVAALAEVKPDLAAKVAAKYGVPKVYTSHEAMLANEKLDALVASQQFTRHGTLVPELLQAGIPVFTEKPLAGTLPMGEKIVEAVNKSGTWMMIGYHKRSDPATMYAKARIDALKASGELGPLKYVRLLMPAGDWVAGGYNDLIRTEESLPGMAWDPVDPGMDKASYKLYIDFVNYYIHQVNLMRHLLGEDYSVSYADPTRVQMTVHSASGVAGVIEMSPFETTIDWQEEALVAFERGYVKLTLPAPLACNRPGSVTLYYDAKRGSTPVQSSPQLPWVDAMRQQALNFVHAIQGEETPLCPAEAALKDLETAREYIMAATG